jgi:trimethylamine---corrinoid protein Co-methyltransferase
LKKAGAFVAEGNRVRIPTGLVEKALSTVPKRVTLYDRYGKRGLYLEDCRCYYGVGSDCLHIIDHRTGERRPAVLRDIEEGIRLCDALPHVDFVMSMFHPSDADARIVDRYQMEVMLNNTAKPIVFVTHGLSGCVDAVEMTEVVSGGPEKLHQRPSIACYINVTSALVHNQEALQKLLYLSDKGLPFTYVPVTTGGMNGPVTPAGAIALNNAGMLIGLVLSQLRREGTPFIAPAMGIGSLDMKSMVCVYLDADFRGLAAAMAHFYGLPCFGYGGVSESHMVDQETSAEAAITLFHDTLFGANLIHDLGFLDGGLTGSFVQVVICNEIIEYLEHLTASIDISDETLALDLIDEMGPTGQYLGHRHTMAHFRKIWIPDLFVRNSYSSWETAGSKNFTKRATERIEKILEEHKPDPLPDDIVQAVNSVVKRAERNA